MSHKNFEFKASCQNTSELEKKLFALSPNFIGEDNQQDTYYNVTKGRLKMREGNIENALIYYERPDVAGAKLSSVILYTHSPSRELMEILAKTYGIKVIVRKRRRIYFIENVKFHFDHVNGLGEFVEVEAIDKNGDLEIGYLQKQCDYYAKYLGIAKDSFLHFSYSDMLIKKESA